MQTFTLSFWKYLLEIRVEHIISSKMYTGISWLELKLDFENFDFSKKAQYRKPLMQTFPLSFGKYLLEIRVEHIISSKMYTGISWLELKLDF